MHNSIWPPPIIRNLHLELTSLCQAQCPACARIYDYNPNVDNHLTPKSWTIEQLNRQLTSSFIKDLKSLLLCGNYGDPLMFNDLASWIETINDINPDLEISIHTNGGIGSEETWQRLGQQLNKSGKFVKFALDGLEDTLSIYRRGVSYNKVIHNAQIFIKNGGRAVWKFLRFSHNSHQEEAAKELSRKLGFYRFEARSAHDSAADYQNFPSLEKIPRSIQESFEGISEQILQSEIFKGIGQNNSISCKAKNNSSIYIDSYQKVWPCCWLSQSGDLRTRTMRREDFHRKVYDQKIGRDFNNLNHHSLSEILSHVFFQKNLPQSWEDNAIKTKKCFPTCLKECGV